MAFCFNTCQIPLPDAVNALQRRFGFAGVAAMGAGDNELVYVAFQREWVDDPAQHVRIGRYVPATGEWTFFYIPAIATCCSSTHTTTHRGSRCASGP
jgi:hypothetical protein